ncbi:MAG: hypothetical protein Q4D42_03090 [Eubacteriales bacterium]|nr:hypothetical protein [Eubacteriales bacterium]
MPEYTENFHLTKPLLSEYYDVDVFNQNADAIDAAIKSVDAFCGTELSNLNDNNLLSDTKTFANVSSGSAEIIDETYKGLSVRYLNTKSASFTSTFITYQNISIWGHDSFTFSFYAKGTPSTKRLQCSFPTGGNTTSAMTSQGSHSDNSTGLITFELPEEWQRYWVTWTVSPTSETNTGVVTVNLLNSAECYMCGCKLEYGMTATDWCPSASESLLSGGSIPMKDSNHEKYNVDYNALADAILEKLKSKQYTIGEAQTSIVDALNTQNSETTTLESRIDALLAHDIYVGSVMLAPECHVTYEENGQSEYVMQPYIVQAYNYHLIDQIFENMTIPDGYKRAYRLSAVINTNNAGKLSIQINDLLLIYDGTWSTSEYRMPHMSRKFYEDEIAYKEFGKGAGLELKVSVENQTSDAYAWGVTIHGYLEKI